MNENPSVSEVLRRVGWGLFALVATTCACSRLVTIWIAQAGGAIGESMEKTVIMTCWMAMSFIIASALDRVIAEK